MLRLPAVSDDRFRARSAAFAMQPAELVERNVGQVGAEASAIGVQTQLLQPLLESGHGLIMGPGGRRRKRYQRSSGSAGNRVSPVSR